MARKTQPTRRRTTPEEDEGLSYEEMGSSGGRPGGVGGRRNVAPGAHNFEPEDYDEENRRNVAGRGGGGIRTGDYEEDYGPGARGHRNPGFDAEPDPANDKEVLGRPVKGGGGTEDVPTGAWAMQRTQSKIEGVRSSKGPPRKKAARTKASGSARRGKPRTGSLDATRRRRGRR